MKRMLFITAYPPSDKGGGEIVTLDAIKTLSKKYTIDLIYFDYPNHQNLAASYANKIEVYNPTLRGCLSKLIYFPLFTRRFNKKLLNKIQEEALIYDIVFFDFSQTAIYSLYLKHPNKVVRCHDVIFQKYGRKSKLILPWVKYSEKKILKSAGKVFTLTEKDSELITKEYGINALYSSDVLNLSKYTLSEDVEMNNKFIFFGFWKRSENIDGLIWFINNVYPLLDKDKKDSLVVMGGGLSDQIYSNYLEKKKISYLGFVEDCYSEIVKYSAMICPLFQGAGIKIKVLDSYATGTPVIGTEIAFEGVPYLEELEYKCETPQQFATVINNFKPLPITRKKQLMNSFNSTKNEKTLINLI